MIIQRQWHSEKRVLWKKTRSKSPMTAVLIHDVDDDGKIILSIDFLNRNIIFSWPELDFRYGADGAQVPIQQQILLLHHLNLAENIKISGEWIAYQEVPDGKFYLDAFLRRAKNPWYRALATIRNCW